MLDPDPESASLMRIRIQGGHLNADSCGSGSETLLRSIRIMVVQGPPAVQVPAEAAERVPEDGDQPPDPPSALPAQEAQHLTLRSSPQGEKNKPEVVLLCILYIKIH